MVVRAAAWVEAKNLDCLVLILSPPLTGCVTLYSLTSLGLNSSLSSEPYVLLHLDRPSHPPHTPALVALLPAFIRLLVTLYALEARTAYLHGAEYRVWKWKC